MSRLKVRSCLVVAIAVFLMAVIVAVTRSSPVGAQSTRHNPVIANAAQQLQAGEQAFRFDTLGTKLSGGTH